MIYRKSLILSGLILLAVNLGGMNAVAAATLAATSCSQTDVQAALNAASNGDTITVPGGNCTWNALSISKGVHLQGAGPGLTNISLTGSGTLTTNAVASLSIDSFRFNRSGTAEVWSVSGAWTNKPLLFHDNEINLSSGDFFHWQVNNGVVFKNVINCKWDEDLIRHKNPNDTQSWSTADTLGMRDTNGDKNLYVEDNTFNNCTNQAMDFDDGSRSVVRYNTFNNSSWNSHGFDTSPIGNRHFEIYNNQFLQQDPSVNQSWQIWIRGGTGVVFNNVIQDLNGTQWGNKSEVQLSVRSASDGGGQYPGGCCTTYPCTRQIGQNFDGSKQFTDPIRFWNNSGNYVVTPYQGWGTCGGPADEFIQSGRDYVMGSARPGYAPYTYPHPLRANLPQPNPPSSVKAN